MKLLYLYIFDYEGIQNQGLNFCSDWRFEYNPGERKLSWTYKPVLPEDFYGKKDSNVECISAIVDESGVGKKAVARLLSEVYSGGQYRPNFVIAIEKDSACKNDNNDPNKKNIFGIQIVYHIAGMTYRNMLDSEYVREKSRDSAYKEWDKEIDLPNEVKGIDDVKTPFRPIYVSPYYSFEETIISNKKETDDLSEIGKVFDAIRKGSDIIEIGLQRKNDFKAALDFVLDESSSSKGIIPKIEQVKLAPNDYLFRQIYSMTKDKVNIPHKEKNNLSCQVMRALLDGYFSKGLFGKIFYCFLAGLWYDGLLKQNGLGLPDKNMQNFSSDGILNKPSSTIVSFGDIEKSVEPYNASGFFRKFEEYIRRHNCNDNEIDVNLYSKEGRSLFEEYYRCASITNFANWSFVPTISPGWQSLLLLFSRIKNNLSSTKQPCVVFLDDVEMIQYPRDQRKLVKGFLEFFQENFKNCRFHLIFASASPVLLSDIPAGNACIFRETKGVKQLRAINARGVSSGRTFGANIFDLYNEFFSTEEGTIGEFAMDKINALLETATDILEKNLDRPKKTRVKFGEADKKLIHLIGESIIRTYFEKLMK